MNLLLSQVNVVPSKAKTTIPRNELNSLVLGAKLNQKLHKVTKLKLPTYVHGDNTCVIAQAQKAPALSSTYVANRVRFIQEHLNVEKLVYINTKDNICADSLSRALSPAEFMNNFFIDCWFNGPPVCRSENWTPLCKKFETNLEEKKKVQVKKVIISDVNPLKGMIEGTKSLSCLVRALARITRWANNAKASVANGAKKAHASPYTSEEVTKELHKVIMYVQSQEFSHEREILRKGLQVRSGPLANLAPYLDAGIIRSYGRLSNSKALPSNTKFPIILPRLGSLRVGVKTFTQLVLDDAHRETLHGGVAVMRQYVRKDYWLLHATKGSSSIRRACVMCKRFTTQVQHQLMGNLIPEVLMNHRPYDIISIDYAGPFLIYVNKRKSALGKAYALVIKCLISKGVVLELVGDMTAEAHLAALRRAFSYTSTPLMIISDRGSNFIKGNKLIDEDLKATIMQGDRQTQEYCANKEIKFKLLPPQASSTGGQHEVEVKIMKMHLKKVLGTRNLSFEQLQTVLKQAQVVMNQRPLSAMYDEPGNFEAITPFSAYTGKDLSLMVEPDKRFVLDKNHFRMLQGYVQQVQSGIINDISRLSMTRAKWQTKTNPVKKNQMVLVRDNRVSPSYWKLARVSRLLPDKSGSTRLVEVIRPVYNNEKYPKGPNAAIRKRIETRHVTQLAPLPVDAEDLEEVRLSDYLSPEETTREPVDNADAVAVNESSTEDAPVDDAPMPSTDSREVTEMPDDHVDQETDEIVVEEEITPPEEVETAEHPSPQAVEDDAEQSPRSEPTSSEPSPGPRRSKRVRKPPLWLTLMTLLCVLPNVQSQLSRLVPSQPAELIKDVSSGILLTHMASAELKAGEAILVIQTGANLTRDENEIDHVVKAFHRICEMMRANAGIRESAPNCWSRYEVFRHAAQRTKCIIDSFYHLDKSSENKRGKRATNTDLEDFIRKLPASGKDPQEDAEEFDFESLKENAENSTKNGEIVTEADLNKFSKHFTYEAINCPYNPPLLRSKRKGVLNWLWGFLFAGDETSETDHNELRFHEYQTNVQLSAVKHGINQNAVNAELFRSAHNQLLEGLDAVARNQIKYNHHEMTSMLTSQTLNVMQTLEDLQLQYVEWDNEASLLMGMEQARREFEHSLPARFKLSKASDEQLLKVADKWTEVANNTVIIKVKVPVVFKKSFEILKITPIPDMATQTILNIPHNLIAINEGDMEFVYMDSNTKTQRLNDDLTLVDETILKVKAPSDCISAAILRSDNKPNCTLRSLPRVYNHWERLNLNTYLFYTNEASGGWLKCSNARTKIEKRIGIIKIPSDCSVTSYDQKIIGRLGLPAFSNFFLIPHEELNIEVNTERIQDVNLNITVMRALAVAEMPSDLPIYEEGWLTIAVRYIWQIIGGIVGIAILLAIAVIATLCIQKRRQKIKFDLSELPKPMPRTRTMQFTDQEPVIELPLREIRMSNGNRTSSSRESSGSSLKEVVTDPRREPMIFLRRHNEGDSRDDEERVTLRNLILYPDKTMEALTKEQQASRRSSANPFSSA